MAQKQKPVHEIRLGRIQAAIWANTNKDGEVWFNVTFSRSYMDKDGEKRKYTPTFRRDDLLTVAKVADMAFDWIWEQNGSVDSDEASV